MDSNNNSANMKLSPGMMCLVIGYVGEPHNVGKTVTLKKVASGILPDGRCQGKVFAGVIGQGVSPQQALGTEA